LLTSIHSSIAPATLAITDTTIPPFSFPAVTRKKFTIDFDGGRLASDGGVTLQDQSAFERNRPNAGKLINSKL